MGTWSWMVGRARAQAGAGVSAEKRTGVTTKAYLLGCWELMGSLHARKEVDDLTIEPLDQAGNVAVNGLSSFLLKGQTSGRVSASPGGSCHASWDPFIFIGEPLRFWGKSMCDTM